MINGICQGCRSCKGNEVVSKTQDKVLELTRRTPLSTVTKCLSKVRSAMVKYKSSDMLDYFFFWKINREETSLRRVTMVAKFLDDNKPKTSLKNWIRKVSNFSDLTQIHSICKILVKLSGVESKRITNSIKRACQIRKFDVTD